MSLLAPTPTATLRVELPSPLPGTEPITRWLLPLLGAIGCLVAAGWTISRAGIGPREAGLAAIVGPLGLILAGLLARAALARLPIVGVSFDADGQELTVVQRRAVGRTVVRCRLDRLQGLLVHPGGAPQPAPPARRPPRRKKKRSRPWPVRLAPSRPVPTAELIAIDADGRLHHLAVGYPSGTLYQLASQLQRLRPGLPLNPALGDYHWPVVQNLHIHTGDDGGLTVTQSPSHGLGLMIGVSLVLTVAGVLALMLVTRAVQDLGKARDLTDPAALLPAVFLFGVVAVVLWVAWAIVRFMLSSRRLTIGPDGVLLERLGVLGWGRVARRLSLDRVAGFSVQERRHKRSIVGYDLTLHPRQTNNYFKAVGCDPEDRISLERLCEECERLLHRLRPAAPSTDLLADRPWPGRIVVRHEADDALVLECPAPGLTLRLLFPMLLGIVVTTIGAAFVASWWQGGKVPTLMVFIAPIVITIGLILIGWSLWTATCRVTFRIDRVGLTAETWSLWSGRQRLHWRFGQVREVAFTGNGASSLGQQFALVSGLGDCLTVTAGGASHLYLYLYWPEELQWCAEVIARALHRPRG